MESMVYRKIETNNGRTYLVPVNVPNAADYIHVDVHDPTSRGYGGRTLEFPLEDGTMYKTKGPWHTNSEALLKETGIDIRELHGTKVTIWSVVDEVSTFKEYVRQEDGTLKWMDVTRPRPVKGEVIYEEQDYCLGDFHRGERVAQAIADIRQETVKFKSESRGGAVEAWKTPNDPIEARKAKPTVGLSPEQQSIVEA